jgi:hypothetical protein
LSAHAFLWGSNDFLLYSRSRGGAHPAVDLLVSVLELLLVWLDVPNYSRLIQLWMTLGLTN